MKRAAAMLVLLVFALCGGPPTAHDGFLANRRSLSGTARMVYRVGMVNRKTIKDPAVWQPGEIEFVEPDHDRWCNVLWRTDGRFESYQVAPLPESWARDQEVSRRSKTNSRITTVTEPFQLVVGQNVCAILAHQSPTILYGNPKSAFTGYEARIHKCHGPFSWLTQFPDTVFSNWQGVEPTWKEGNCGGHRVLMASRTRPLNKKTIYLEVGYDPAIGYIPRLTRTVAWNPEKDEAFVREAHVRKAMRTEHGGFLPTDWVETWFAVPRFQKSYPNYDSFTRLEPALGLLRVGQLLVTRHDEQPAPLALDAVKLRWVETETQKTKIPKGIKSLTMDEIGALAIRGAAKPKLPTPPEIDIAEVHRLYNRPHSSSPWTWIIGTALGLLGIALLVYVWRRHRWGTICLAWVIGFIGSGCGRTDLPSDHTPADSPVLHVEMQPKEVLFDPDIPWVSTALRLKNNSAKLLTINGVKTGCSCTAPGNEAFPLDIAPGGTSAVKLMLHVPPEMEQRSYAFCLDTSQGQVRSRAALMSLPRLQFFGAVEHCTQLSRTEDVPLRLAIRQIVHRSEKLTETNLVASTPRVIVIKKSVRRGIGPTARYQFLDTQYELCITDKSTLGEQEEPLVLRAADETVVAQTPLRWRRTPEVWLIPEEIHLADRPVRVLLRSTVGAQFVRVLQQPKGCDVKLVTPRELLVTPTPDAPDQIKDVVVLATSAKPQPRVSIPVIRFSEKRL